MALRLDDRDLVLAYQRGDTDAFAELVREYRPQLLGVARRRLGSVEAAEDAVQEALLRAMRAMPRFNGNYLVGPWLHRILSNVCADEGNRRRRELEKTTRLASSDKALAQPPSTEAELGLDLDHADLAEAVGSLSVEYRQALMLRFVEQLSYEEVAEAAGISEANARARVSRARNAVRSALKLMAAAPLALVGLLRRGERAASAVAGAAPAGGRTAAVQSAAMPLLAEAGPAATRVVAAATNAAAAGLPVMAKAAAGVGLAAAVITPTVDSPVHRVTERVLPDSVVSVLAPLAVEVPAPSAPVVVPALPNAAVTEVAVADAAVAEVAIADAADADAAVAEVVIADAADADAAVSEVAGTADGEATAAAGESVTAAAAVAEPETSTEVVAVAEGEASTGDSDDTLAGAAVAGDTSGTGAADGAVAAASETATDDAPLAEPAPTVVISSSGAADGAVLEFVAAGADRFDVTGTVTVAVTTTTTSTKDDGATTTETVTTTEQVSVVAPSSASLTVPDPGDAQAQQRFSALLVLVVGDSTAEMRLAARGAAADGALPLEGQFTATSSDALPLAQRGTMKGTLTFADDGTPQSLALTLAS